MKADKETRLIDMSIGAMIMAIVIIVAVLLSSCSATRPYKVTFANGDVEYYELDYKPKATHKYIRTQDGVHIGVTKIERVK